MKNGNFLSVYYADVKILENPDIFNHFYELADDRRKSKINSLVLTKDKILSLGVDILLKYALKDLGYDENLKREINEFGKEDFLSESQIHFNVSHSGDIAVCVLSNFEVGVDVEKDREPNLKIARRFFTKSENLYLKKCPEDFTKLWTLKESLIKCDGRGLRLPLNSFSIKFLEGEPAVAFDDKIDVSYMLKSVEFSKDYKMSVCVKNSANHVNFYAKQVFFNEISNC